MGKVSHTSRGKKGAFFCMFEKGAIFCLLKKGSSLLFYKHHKKKNIAEIYNVNNIYNFFWSGFHGIPFLL